MLIDDLINLKEAKSDNLDKVLMEALRFQVDNVAKYHYESMPRSYQDHEKRGRYRLEEHIPNLAPLANVMWFEYSGPSVGLPPFDRCGCLVCVVYEREYWQEHKLEGFGVSEKVRWILYAEYFTYRQENNKFEIGVSDWRYFLWV